MTEDKSFEKTLESLLVNVFFIYPDPVQSVLQLSLSVCPSLGSKYHILISLTVRKKSLMHNLLKDHGT